jgi:hypothetical protein
MLGGKSCTIRHMDVPNVVIGQVYERNSGESLCSTRGVFFSPKLLRQSLHLHYSSTQRPISFQDVYYVFVNYSPIVKYCQAYLLQKFQSAV